MGIIRRFTAIVAIIASAILSQSCESINDDRIPALAVNINLGDPAIWNAYGVSGFGIYKYFILSENKPSGFPYNARSATGFGGILLIGGMDPFTNDTNIPLAYDLACPVERQSNVRVIIDETTYEAYCPLCGARYDVTMAGGAPTATSTQHKYAMRRYSVLPAAYGGYLVTN